MHAQDIADAAKDIKLVVSYLDSTLIVNHGPLSSRTLSAITALRQKGIRFALDTGRDYLQLQPYISALQLEGPIAVNGGSRVVQAQTGEMLWCQSFDETTLRALLCGLAEANIPFIVEDGLCWWLHGNMFVSQWAAVTNGALQAGGYRTAQVLRFDPARSFAQLLQGTPAKVDALLRSKRQLPQMQQLLCKLGLDAKRSGINSFDILPAGVNKASGLRKLAQLYGLDASACAAFGDSYNDVPMLQSAGLSFAMGNAVDEAKQAARFVIGAAKDDGVARCLEQFFL